MKVVVLHGDDEKKIYERLQKFVSVAKERAWEMAQLDESDISVREQLNTSSLFSANRFFTLKEISKLGKKELEWLAKNYENLDGTLIIYHEGVIPISFLKALPKETKIEEFKLPVLLWNFLDGLAPGNCNRQVSTFHKIIEKQPVEFIFSLIAKHFRNLYWVAVDPTSTGFPFWKLGKLKSQASRFTVEKLQQLIGSLAEIDIKVKTSKANLTDELDLIIIKQLE
jgi:DNA polymerase III delta subunit